MEKTCQLVVNKNNFFIGSLDTRGLAGWAHLLKRNWIVHSFNYLFIVWSEDLANWQREPLKKRETVASKNARFATKLIVQSSKVAETKSERKIDNPSGPRPAGADKVLWAVWEIRLLSAAKVASPENDNWALRRQPSTSSRSHYQPPFDLLAESSIINTK